MEKLSHKYDGVLLSATDASIGAQLDLSSDLKQRLVLTSVSEPEGGLERYFYIETNDKNYIKSLVIKANNGATQNFEFDKMLNEEAIIAKVRGFDAVMIQILYFGADIATVRIRYLEQAPCTFGSFELKIRKDSQGEWAIYENDRPRLVKWMFFRSRTFLGMVVGVDSYDLSQEIPLKAI